MVDFVLVALKKKYLPYPVTPDWCDRVRSVVDKMPRGAYARMAEYCDTETGHLAETLKCRYQTSDLVEPIHEFLKWDPPIPPTAAVDAGELVHLFQRLTPAQRAMISEAGEVLDGKHGEQAKRALGEMLKLFGATRKND